MLQFAESRVPTGYDWITNAERLRRVGLTRALVRFEAGRKSGNGQREEQGVRPPGIDSSVRLRRDPKHHTRQEVSSYAFRARTNRGRDFSRTGTR